MKAIKFLLFALICMMAENLNAQSRCAVLGFSNTSTMSHQDIEGIDETFRAYFQPEGYIMVEKTQIDEILSQHRFKIDSLTEDEIISLAKMLNVSRIIYGEICNAQDSGYQVNVYSIYVYTNGGKDTLEKDLGESHVVTGDYKTSIKEFAQVLSERLAMPKLKEKCCKEKIVVYEVYDFSEISISPEERAHLLKVLGYVDLGLPSGTMWKNENEKKPQRSMSQRLRLCRPA